MKKKGIFIDLGNKEQVEWWNDTASKLVHVERYDTIVETATNKVVGVLFGFKRGLLNDYVVKENRKFLGQDIVEMVFESED